MAVFRRVSHQRRRAAAAISAAALALGLAACAPPADTEAPADAGGTVRLGMIGSQGDVMQPYQTYPALIDTARAYQVYEGLTRVTGDGTVEMALAESFDSNDDFTEWTVTLRPGVLKHNGEAFTADDVVQSVQEIMDPENNWTASSRIPFVDPDRVTATDDSTVVFELTSPYSLFPEIWASARMPVSGWDGDEPVGTGMFMPDSFTPGQVATFKRFDDYWGDKPEFETLEILSFADQPAITNALRGGQIDIAATVPYTDAQSLAETPGLAILESKNSIKQVTMEMKSDEPPFDDPRVREAFKLIIDRNAVVDNAYAGFASVGNDYPAFGDSCPTPTDIPQREQDLDRAKQLLEEAGQTDLTVEFAMAPGAAGGAEIGEIFAQNAAEIGVTVKLNMMDTATYLAGWKTWPFGLSFFDEQYIASIGPTFMPDGPNNGSFFDNAEYVDLVDQLYRTGDHDAQCAIIHEMHRVVHEEGGIINPAIPSALTAHSDKVHGLQESIFNDAAYRFAGVSIEG